MKYLIEIVETNCRLETVEAESAEEAMEKVESAYKNGDLILDDTNSFVDVDFNYV